MRVQVNGEEQQLPDTTTVGQLLDRLGMNPDGVAVAVNLEVVPRGRHAEHVLVEHDQVELVRAVGGG